MTIRPFNRSSGLTAQAKKKGLRQAQPEFREETSAERTIIDNDDALQHKESFRIRQAESAGR